MARVPRSPDSPPFGANVVGYLEAELGVAEVARQAIGALDTQSVPVLPVGLEAPGSRHGHSFGHIDHFENPFALNLMCVNADQTPNIAAAAGPDFFTDRHTIGLWWWEIAEIPEFFTPAFAVVDEVWACSTFIADNLRAVSPVPVTRVPLPITLSPGIEPDRARFGFGDETVFLFVFDYHSIVARKNPFGLVEAYLQAFPELAATRLVIKSINGEHHAAASAKLRAMAATRADIELIEDYLPAHERDALLASCDCYVSLHRSEGFGLTCAEAMALGKPVIATAYSGSADYMLDDHSLPVGSHLTTVGEGSFPYAATARWAEPDLVQAAGHMRAVAGDPELRRRLGDRARAFVGREYSSAAAGAAMRSRLEAAHQELRAGSRRNSGLSRLLRRSRPPAADPWIAESERLRAGRAPA